MNICVIGTGYVGLVAGTCLANLGNDVICVDKDEDKISNLKKGLIPIYEPELHALVERNSKENRLKFTTDLKSAVEKSDIVFIAVGTPSNKTGGVDLSFVESVADEIGKSMNNYKVIVDKSTVPVGTAEKVKEIIRNHYDKEFDVVSNPEFLREGAAVRDFFNPDRIILGVESRKAEELMRSIYKSVERVSKPIFVTDVKNAELIKYSSNAFLATKISFINEISRLCEKVGANITEVAKGMGLDERIGPRFLHAGIGYGGSCFPKDVKALINTAKESGMNLKILESVEEVNSSQRLLVIPKIKKLLGDVKGKTISIWGLSFKPKTDDIREAPAMTIINELKKMGAKIKVFDPVAMESAKGLLDDVQFTKNPYETVEDADCLVIATEWDEFRNLDMDKVRKLMKSPNIVDGRNIYNPKDMKKQGLNYVSMGR